MKKTFNQEFIEKSGGESITSLLTIEELALYLQGGEAGAKQRTRAGAGSV